jgi:hypothetical protein
METVKHTKIKEILDRNADGQIGNDTAALELEQLINEYVASATNRGFKEGFETANPLFE